MRAVARYDWGRWVADCPNPRCTNADALEVGQTQFHCTGVEGSCGTWASIDWPDDPVTIERDLAHLPESQQHWRPAPGEQP